MGFLPVPPLIAPTELEINWPYLYGAESYELEWTYINNYPTDLYNPISTPPFLLASAIPFTDRDFELNNTRVKTGFNKYVIPLIYDKGFIIYRVRGVGRDMNNPSHIIYGKWSEKAIGSSKIWVNDYNNYEITDAHDPDKNWQYVANYAEEGKKKEVVSYFDGSLRNRQTVTRTNTNNKTIVGETIYDHQGRAAIQTLPVPILSNELRYFGSLNNSSTTLLPYSRLDFDEDANCVAVTAPMSAISGSANYYSPLAPNLPTDPSYQDLVPDAGGFPFTQTEYLPDNTGRIRRQTGVGPEHQLGAHETMYFYGKPHQEQLDRLFSYNVGYKSRYKKNMVVDPNGQVSVTYIDPQGRTIATALAGNKPANLEVVADKFGVDNFPAVLTLNIDILNKIDPNDVDTPQDDNLLYSTGSLGPSNDGLMVSMLENNPIAGGNYTFDYNLTLPVFTETNGCLGAKGYPVVYDLSMSMKDKCAEEQFVYRGTSTSVDIDKQVVGIVDLSGTGTSSTHPESFDANTLPIGTYTVSKKLAVNGDALEEYVQQYIVDGQTAGCIDEEKAYIDHYAALIDESCETTCFSCLDDLAKEVGLTTYTLSSPLPTLSEWRTIWDTHMNPYPTTPNTIQQAIIDRGFTETLWELAYEECTDACTEISVCESGYQAMLADASPGGIYFGNSIDWRTPQVGGYLNLDGTPAIVVVSEAAPQSGIYIPAVLVTPVSDGNGGFFVYPHQLQNDVDFVVVFEPHWAEAIVDQHPEHCYYENCMELSNIPAGASMSSENFDIEIRGVELYSTATSISFYGTTFTTASPNIASFSDPYFDFFRKFKLYY